MSELSKREYNKLEMRKLRVKWREQKMIRKGQCPAEGCGMSLKKKFERYHVDCVWFKNHANSANSQIVVDNN